LFGWHVTSQDPYLANTELIEKATRFACRRHHLYAADAQDFASVARLHLIDRDYAVLRAFKGQSLLQTYLVTVLTRCFLDWRNSRWGKWRNSAEARRMGPMAVHLETLINRDGYSFEEAYQTLRSRHGLSESPEALQAIAARLPRRTRRSFTSDGALEPCIRPRWQASLPPA
jgi:DNA-directed RNA polymerase specialized sigma24 family protein